MIKRKKGLPTENGEESFLVDYMIEISNLKLVKDMEEIVDKSFNF